MVPTGQHIEEIRQRRNSVRHHRKDARKRVTRIFRVKQLPPSHSGGRQAKPGVCWCKRPLIRAMPVIHAPALPAEHH